MPRVSLRKKRTQRLKIAVKKRLQFRFLRELFEQSDEEQDCLDDAVVSTLALAESTRYHQERVNYRKPRMFLFDEDLNEEVDEKGEKPWLNEREFQQKYRCSRTSFKALVELIKDDPVFQTTRDKINGRDQAEVSQQLLVLLKFLGTEGSGGSNANLRSVFGIGEGTVNLYRDRVVQALLNLKDSVITWPNKEERTMIAGRFFEDYKWPNCVGVIDGTLFPLAFRPQSKDAPDYSGRKFAYSISSLIICDDQRCIRYVNAGWPGTAHDNRILRNSKVYQHASSFFSDKEYMLGDSAFENTWFLVSAFKKPRNSTLPHDQELFNDALKTPRVLSEHTIGILKGRFPWLRSIRNLVTDNPKDMKKILNYIMAACILHNLLLDCLIPDEWIDRDDITDIDDPDCGCLDDNDELNLAVPEGAAGDHRRQQLLPYIREHHFM